MIDLESYSHSEHPLSTNLVLFDSTLLELYTVMIYRSGQIYLESGFFQGFFHLKVSSSISDFCNAAL